MTRMTGPDCAVMCNLINTHTHTHTHTHTSGRGTKKRKKPQNSCRRRAGNGGDMGGKRKKCRKERVRSVAANSDDLGSYKEAGGGEHKVLRAQVRFVQVERVCPLCRV